MIASPKHRVIGSWRGVSIEVAVWDGASAAVDMSCACMFAHEVGIAGPTGGFAHLDDALGGALTLLRREKHFGAAEGETALINRPGAAVAAASVLVVGLGEPSEWTSATMARAVASAFRCGAQQAVQSLAFAPSMLDGGLTLVEIGDTPGAMIVGLCRAINAQIRLADLGLADRARMDRWVFDAGETHFETAADQFGTALAAQPS